MTWLALPVSEQIKLTAHLAVLRAKLAALEKRRGLERRSLKTQIRVFQKALESVANDQGYRKE